jgi:hypothetical protein
MRPESLAFWRSRFAGLSPAGVTRLAASMPPVRVSLVVERGRTRVILDDGRHRLQAAREAGASKIAVEARVMGERGALSSVWRGNAEDLTGGRSAGAAHRRCAGLLASN